MDKETKIFTEIKEVFGDCDWMRAFLNNYVVESIIWLIKRVEKLESKEELESKEVEDLLKKVDFDLPDKGIFVTVAKRKRKLYDVNAYTVLYGILLNILKRLEQIEKEDE